MHEQLTEWWNGVSLRSKITGVTVMLLTLGLLVAGLGTMTFLRNYLFDGVNEKIASVVSNPQSALVIACNRSGLLPDTYMFVASIDTTGHVNCENNTPGAATPAISASTLPHSIVAFQPFAVHDKDHTTEWRVVGIPITSDDGTKGAVLVGVDLAETNSTVGRFALVFLIFSLTVVIFGGALTRLLVTSTFAPLREVEATAARFAAGDFSQRLERAPRNTEVGRLNESLNLMLSRIDASFADRVRTIQQMRRFVGDASHELRTPLVSVRGYAELYRMGALGSPEEVAQAMERIEKEAIRMSELVGDLLELARIDEAKPLNLTAVDLVPLANDAAMDAMASSPDRTISVVVSQAIHPTIAVAESEPTPDAVAPRTGTIATRSSAFAGATLNLLRRRRTRPIAPLVPQVAPISVAPQSGAVVLAEENKIRQVVTNLMGNALRFTAPGSPIEIGVTVDQSDGCAYISVIDHGEGIPPQIREKIFQRFWRADSSRNRDTGGSGLGLAIVASIVASHKGAVDVVETPGGGSTFRVRLPLLPDRSSADAVPISA
jgi:two-component system OmpR family sensor kinase